MSPTIRAFDDLTAIPQLDGLRAEFSRWKKPLTPPQVQQLDAHARTLVAEPTALRLGIIHTYTSDLLTPWLQLAGSLQGLAVDTYHAPYGMALQEARAGSGLLAHRPDITLLMLRRDDLHPALAGSMARLGGADRARVFEAALGQLQSMLGAFRAHAVGHLVLTLLPALDEPALGVFDAQAEHSETAGWATFKSTVAGWMRDALPAALFLDLDEVLGQVGRDAFFDRRYWYSARYPFAPAAAREVARRVLAVGVVLKRPRAKVIVLDADNTLWGGTVGEDGAEGIALGPDYPGVAYADFQRRLLGLQARGFILALCSKNNAADVAEVLREHPHQLLRDEHFAAQRVNWLPKCENLVSLAEELGLGLESFVFVDDSDHECDTVRRALPQVEVVQTPARPVDVPTCLDAVARLEVLSLTAEDAAKTDLYAQARQRREWGDGLAKAGGATGDAAADHLARLQTHMRVQFNAAAHVARLSQLTQKTNQFNLTTRRCDEQQMKAFMEAGDSLVAHFSLADVFGDSGIVGVAIVRIVAPERAELHTFLMSCRVIGRQAEGAFLATVMQQLAALGVRELVADFIPTPKNEPAGGFLSEQGFGQHDDGRWRRELRMNEPTDTSRFPMTVTVDASDSRLSPRQPGALKMTATVTTATRTAP